MILACCISPARSLGVPRNFKLETVSKKLGTANAPITSIKNETSTSSTRVNPPARSCCLQDRLELFFIIVSYDLELVSCRSISHLPRRQTRGARRKYLDDYFTGLLCLFL